MTTVNSWSQVFAKNTFNEPELSDFCPDCGNLLNFVIVNKKVECSLCKSKIHISSKFLDLSYICIIELMTLLEIQTNRTKVLPFFEESEEQADTTQQEVYRAEVL